MFLILPTMTVVFNVLYTASGYRKLATHLIAWMLRIALSLFQYSPMMLIFTFLRFKAKIWRPLLFSIKCPAFSTTSLCFLHLDGVSKCSRFIFPGIEHPIVKLPLFWIRCQLGFWNSIFYVQGSCCRKNMLFFKFYYFITSILQIPEIFDEFLESSPFVFPFRDWASRISNRDNDDSKTLDYNNNNNKYEWLERLCSQW